MAKITDPDDLTQGTEIDFISGSLLIRLNFAGNLNSDGVTGQALYSFVKEEWKDDSNLVKFPFPMISITTEQFEFINDWNLSGSLADISASQYLIRDAGWAQVDLSSGNTFEKWMNSTTLGSFDDSAVDQAYYYQSASGTISNFQLAGEVNQAVQFFVTNSFDYEGFYKIYLREQGKTYGFGDLIVDQNLTAVDTKKFAQPLTNGTDLNISSSDATIDSLNPPFDGMSINYYTASQARTIGGPSYNFKVIIDGNSGTKQQIYEFVQRKLRSGSNIDSNDNILRGITGSVAEELLDFVGSTLKTKQQTDVGGSGAGGVYIDNFLAIDTNDLVFVDDGGTERSFPFVAAGSILFNTNLSTDTDAIYKLFFTNDDAGDNTGRDFGTDTAILINDNSGPNPITGSVAASSSVSFDYDYDGNIQRGSDSSGSDVPFTGIALGLNTAQYVVTTGTWTRSTSNAVNFVAALERNYSNP